MEVYSRALLEARGDKSFWDKYKALIIGGAVAVPIQLVALYFYLRYRKRKKAAAARIDSGDDRENIYIPNRR